MLTCSACRISAGIGSDLSRSFAPPHEFLAARAALQVRIAGPLLGDAQLPGGGPPVRPVVVAGEQPRVGGQREDRHDRMIERDRVAAGKIRTRRAVVRLEQRVVDEGGVADDVSDRRFGVPGREHHARLQIADRKRVAVREQAVPLRAVRREIRQVVDRLPQLLHVGDLLADRGRRAELLLQVDGGGEMVGVRMRVEDPVDGQAALRDHREHLVGGLVRYAAGLGIVVEHRIDDGRTAGRRVLDQIRDAACRLVIEAGHQRRGHACPQAVFCTQN